MYIWSCQRKNESIFGHIPGVHIYFDDIIIASKTEHEINWTLKAVLKFAETNNVKFNFEKLRFKMREVNFVGYEITTNGIKPSKKNIESPKNKQEFLRVLGLFKFFSKYIPNLSSLNFNMRNLTKNNSQFAWTDKKENELKQWNTT